MNKQEKDLENQSVVEVKIFCKTPPNRQTKGSAGYDVPVGISNVTIKAYDALNRDYTVQAARADGQDCDICRIENKQLVIAPRHRVRIPLGIYTEPKNSDAVYYFSMLMRSGTAWKKGLCIPNAQGVIDLDYRGQWHLVLFNPLDCSVSIDEGERIVQIIATAHYNMKFVQVENMQDFETTERGIGGFGSTGSK